LNKLLASFFLGICIFLSLSGRAEKATEAQIQTVVCHSMIELLDAYQGQLRFLERNPRVIIDKTTSQWAYDMAAKRMVPVITSKGIEATVAKERFEKVVQAQRTKIADQYDLVLKDSLTVLSGTVFHDCTTQWDSIFGH